MGSLLNATNSIIFPLMETGYEIDPGILGAFAKAIIEGIGIIGVGIIVFALVLKAIVLPFDIYQRVKMRKQTLVMREMQPELEKLQKQYANDKTMYNQKMMELYKKNGYSIFGACLPMIISMAILIVAFQGFRAYSSYANLNMYEGMSVAYSEALMEYVVEGKDYHLPVEGVDDDLTIEWELNGTFTDEEAGIVYTMFYPAVENPLQHLRVESKDDKKFIFYEYVIDKGIIGPKAYQLDIDKLYSAIPDEDQKAIDKAVAGGAEKDIVCRDYVNKIGATAVKEWYEGTETEPSHESGFLWVKNVWYPDVSYEHPIQDYSKFKQQFDGKNVTFREDSVTMSYKEGDEASLSTVLDEFKYKALISELGDESEQPNGYFILIILSIGLMVLSQFISMRSQKETNKYQTVDGSGARTQKIMLVMMPLIYAVFAFMYSAAFSIYMVMSSFISLCTTLLANLIIGRIFRKKETEAFKEKHTRKLPWMQQQEQTKKGKKGRK